MNVKQIRHYLELIESRIDDWRKAFEKEYGWTRRFFEDNSGQAFPLDSFIKEIEKLLRENDAEWIKKLQEAKGIKAIEEKDVQVFCIQRLSDYLYQDLPIWKRKKIRTFYEANGWDSTGEYKKCVNTARKMVIERESWMAKFFPEVPAYCKECINYAPNSEKKYCKTGIKMINKKKCMYHRLAKLTNKKQK